LGSGKSFDDLHRSDTLGARPKRADSGWRFYGFGMR